MQFLNGDFTDMSKKAASTYLDLCEKVIVLKVLCPIISGTKSTNFMIKIIPTVKHVVGSVMVGAASIPGLLVIFDGIALYILKGNEAGECSQTNQQVAKSESGLKSD